jgi:pyrroloquinoline quinone (PQQ) biosynthesis protein C
MGPAVGIQGGGSAGMTHRIQEQYRVRRVYAIDASDDGAQLWLSDRVVELGANEFDRYRKVAAWLPSVRDLDELLRDIGMNENRFVKFVRALEYSGLLYRVDGERRAMTGLEFHAIFASVIGSWLSEAFGHPFWARMMSGHGSARLFIGWLFELYHFTRNANRHMPLSCAHAEDKRIKQLRAKHYAEEWNHYHYFMKSLKAFGFAEAQIADSVPLPMTIALSNFMRQAAREDILAYSICSAVLEATTTDRTTYGLYYEKVATLYGVTREAIAPIWAHLDLDEKYAHSELFREILAHVPEISADRVTKVLSYGHQLVEHIWLWTDNIEKYYQTDSNQVPRRPFDVLVS